MVQLATGDLDLYRWKGKKCLLCESDLDTTHVLTCDGTSEVRTGIEGLCKIRAERVIKDPSLLNKLPKCKRKNVKPLIADRVTMIRSVGG